MGERQARETRLEKTVDAHAVFIRRHGDGLDASRDPIILRCRPKAGRRKSALAALRLLLSPISGKPEIGG
jgi:hypothetical protein